MCEIIVVVLITATHWLTTTTDMSSTTTESSSVGKPSHPFSLLTCIICILMNAIITLETVLLRQLKVVLL